MCMAPSVSVLMVFTTHHRECLVTLSAAKGLTGRTPRSFAALRMTRAVVIGKNHEGQGVGWMKGPRACPGGNMIRLGFVKPPGHTPTRTSTRPLHPPHPAPCPYRTG